MSDERRTSPLSAAMDELVAGARSARDGVFNTLDAVQRQTRVANQSLVAQIEAQVDDVSRRGPASTDAGAEPERDARFDPEDEWEVAGPDAVASGAAASNTPVRDDDDDDGYGQTWLR